MQTTARYWREIPQRYRTEAGKCSSCGTVYFPPRRVCAECAGREFTDVVLSNKGKVETFTIIKVAPDEFSDLAPYAVGLVELDGGVRIMTQVVDCDPETIEIGMPVELEFRLIRAEGEAGVLFYGYKAVPAR